MKQHDAVIEVMRTRGGYATLGQLYQEVLKVPGVTWNTKTPFASIRRIVQDERFFFRIRPGLWALKDIRHRLPIEIRQATSGEANANAEFDHAYFQGLLVEVGNLRGWTTYVPPQDKNRLYLGQPLRNVAKLADCFDFSYQNIVGYAKTVDVVWFNRRRMPQAFMEVEHTTAMLNSLAKFVELQDFYSDFVVVAPQARKGEFQKQITRETLRPIAQRVQFWSYEAVSRLHTQTAELTATEQFLRSA